MEWIGKPASVVPLWLPILASLAFLWSAAIVILGTRSCAGFRGVCGLSSVLAWAVAIVGLGVEWLALYLIFWGLHVRRIGVDEFGFHLQFARGFVAIAWSDVFRTRSPGRKGYMRLYFRTGRRFLFFPGIQQLPSTEVDSVLARLGQKLEFWIRPQSA